MKHLTSLVIGISCFIVGFITSSVMQPAPLQPTTDQYKSSTIPASPLPESSQQPSQLRNMNQLPVTATIDKDNRDAIIAKLQQQLAQLQASQVASEHKQHKMAAELEQATASNNYENEADDSYSDGNNDSESSEPPARRKISKEKAESLLPRPFSDIVAGSEGQAAEDFNKFNDDTQDYNWSVLTENHIKDFITMHELGSGIEINSVICKTHNCEIRIFEREPRTWQIILSTMQRQPWWQFTSTGSSSSSSDEFGQHAYVLVSKDAK